MDGHGEVDPQEAMVIIADTLVRFLSRLSRRAFVCTGKPQQPIATAHWNERFAAWHRRQNGECGSSCDPGETTDELEDDAYQTSLA